MGRDNNWRLIAAAIFAMVPAVVVILGLVLIDNVLVPFETTRPANGEWSSYKTSPAAWPYIKWTGEAIALWTMITLEAVALSLCYRELGGRGEATQPASTES